MIIRSQIVSETDGNFEERKQQEDVQDNAP